MQFPDKNLSLSLPIKFIFLGNEAHLSIPFGPYTKLHCQWSTLPPATFGRVNWSITAQKIYHSVLEGIFSTGPWESAFFSEGFWIIKLYKTQAGRETWVGLVRQGYLSCLTPPLVSGVVVAPQLVFVGLPLKTIASCLESSYCRCCCFYISTIIAMTFGLIEGLRIPSWICKELSDLFCYFSMDGAQRWECRMVWPGWTPLFALTVSQKSTLEVVFRFCLVMGLNSCFLVHVCQNLYKGAYTKRPRPVPDLDNIDSSEFNTSCTSRSFKKQIWGRIYIQQVIFDHFWPRFALHAEQSKVIRGHMCW